MTPLAWVLGLEFAAEGGRHIRAAGGLYNEETVSLAREAACQAAYCLDAPDFMPAGGMWADEFDGETLPMQMIAWREALAA